MSKIRRHSILVALGCATLLAAPAWAFRCGNRLVTEGDTQESVRARCGNPSEIRRRQLLRPAVLWRHGRPFRVGNGPIEVTGESWIYNLGPNRFMRRVRFEDGVVVEIETLGYGYHEGSSPPASIEP